MTKTVGSQLSHVQPFDRHLKKFENKTFVPSMEFSKKCPNFKGTLFFSGLKREPTKVLSFDKSEMVEFILPDDPNDV